MSDIGFRLVGSNEGFRAMVENSQNVLTRFNQVLGSLGVGFSLGALVSFFKEVVEKTGKIQDLSERLGASTDALQAFSYASQQAGATTEQATAAWDKAKKAVDSLLAGETSAAKLFGKIGLSAKDFIGLNMDQGLELIAKGYRSNEDAAGAYDAVTDILGSKTAPKLNTVLLQLGAEGFEVFIEQAKKAGQVIGGETIKAVDTFGDALEREKGRLNTWGANAAGVGIFLNAIPKALMMIVEKSTGIDIPFVGLEAKVAKATERTKELLPQIEILTAEGKKQIVQDLEHSRLGDEKLSREKRLLLLKSDLLDIDDALAKSGLTQYEIDGLSVMRAETVKLIKTEQKALNTDAAKHAQRMEEFTAKEIEDKRALMTIADHMAALREDEAGWLAVLAEKGIETAVRQNAEVELAQTRGKIRDVEKERLQQIADIEAERTVTNTELTREQLNQLSIKEKQALIEEAEVETSRIQTLAVNGMTTAEIERLNVLNQQSAELKNQITLAMQFSAVTRTGKGYDAQSDDSLTGVKNRLKSQIDALKAQSFGKMGGVGGGGKPAEVYLLESELFNLNKEMNERDEVRSFASRFGEQKARQQFGDTLTDKALRDLTDTNVKTSLALDDIQKRLEFYFPKT